MASEIKSPRQQLEVFRSLIEGRTLDRSSPTFEAVLTWMRVFPGELSPDEIYVLRDIVCKCFTINDKELDDALATKKPNGHITEGTGKGLRWTQEQFQGAVEAEDEFDRLLPKNGYFRDYVEFTRQSEGPILYHFFTAVAGLACTINRRVGFSMGPVGKIYPPLGIMLLGPSGIKKTSATDIMVGILTSGQMVPIYSEKVTPEALVDGMKKGQSVGLIYAPELSVFLGKATYLEGIVPLLTRLMDSPDKWETVTISRGKTTLVDVAITCLMCSTSDWFVSNTPADMFGGGFIARNILVHQTISPRIIPIPASRDDALRQKIVNGMLDLHTMQGEMHFSPAAKECYTDFYYRNKMEKPEHEMLESYHQRKGNHAIRLAMLLHLATCGTMEICEECFQRTLNILSFNERSLPTLLRGMFKTEAGLETDKVLRIIRAYDGPIPHSTLVRKLQYTMNAANVKRVIFALKESEEIDEHMDKFSHTYRLKEAKGE